MLCWADEGRQHGIPLCCGIRFGLGCERPKPFARFFPRTAVRFGRTFSPRASFAAYDCQGYLPCEFHLAVWLLTGYRPNIKQD